VPLRPPCVRRRRILLGRGDRVGDSTTQLEVALYRSDPLEHRNVNELDVGLLLGQLVEEPFYLAKANEEGSIQLAVQRRHEWELVVGLALAGGAVFLKGALSELGKRFGGWLAGQVGTLRTTNQPEVRAGQTVHRIDPNALGGVESTMVAVFVEAAEKRVQVRIIVESKA
jgi:hypothetical protein